MEEPEWFDRIAASRLTVSTPHYSRMFEAYNEGKPYREYRSHPEVKSAAPGGGRCDRNTHGLLRRRHVRPLWIQMIGKEANRLEEVQAGQVQDLDEVLEQYSGPEERWNEVVRPILQQIPA